MRIDKENYELLLFELLEGLIPEQQRADLLKQIENDNFLQKEWKWMQQTVMQPDEVVYEGKSDLLKKPVTRLSINRGLAVAASILLVFCIGWFTFDQSNSTDPKAVRYSVRTKITAPAIPAEKETRFAVEFTPEKEQLVTSQPVDPLKEDQRKKKTELPVLSGVQDVQIAQVPGGKRRVSETVTLLPPKMKPNRVVSENEREFNLPNVVNTVLVAAIQTTRFVKEVKNGKVKIKRNKIDNQPAIEVALVTNQYIKSATIQYKNK